MPNPPIGQLATDPGARQSLVVQSLSKRFGSLLALDAVNLEFASGEVHAVLGENGAGKSTLVSLISGFLLPDAGSVSFVGAGQAANLPPNNLPLGDAIGCRRAGVAMVHQHFTLVPNLTVQENLALADLESLRGSYNPAQLIAASLATAERLNWHIDPNALVRTLPVGAQQRIEILKSLSRDFKVVVFDEPTAPLGPDEVQDFLQVLRRLAAEGKIVILIAHKLSEVLEVADRISVLRRGKVVASSLERAGTTAAQLAELMVGAMPALEKRTSPHATSGGLQVSGLTVKGDRGNAAINGVSFQVTPGEILGIGGVDGNGQTELAEALAGVRPYVGTATLNGAPLTSVGYVPADRQRDGLAMGLTIGENLLIGRLDQGSEPQPTASTKKWPSLKAGKAWANGLIQRFSIKAESLSDPIASLSGGNQQKVVVSRTLDRHSQLVVAANPTRGLDVKAARFVHDQLRRVRDEGTCVVLISADLDELAVLADRTCFLSRGNLLEGQDASALVGGTQ